jgi:hypothetical protein
VRQSTYFLDFSILTFLWQNPYLFKEYVILTRSPTCHTMVMHKFVLKEELINFNDLILFE